MRALSVSVIIPAYKAARTINRAVDSVFGQTREPAEVLVVDDGSPDGDDLSVALLRYGGRVNLLRKPNGGAASARNHAIERVRGNVIGFLDADDYWEPDKLEHQLELLDRHPEVGLTASRWYTEEPGKRRTPPADPNDDLVDRAWAPDGPDVFRVACQVSTSTVLVRRDVLGRRRFPTDLETAEDRDLWCRLVATAPVYLSSAPLATMVLEPGSLSRTHVDRDYGNMLRVIHTHAVLLGPRHRRRWEAWTYRQWAGQLLHDGCPAAALRPAVQRLRRRPLSAEGWYILGKCLARCCRQSVPRSVVAEPVPAAALASA
jgi:glycosyltransferase involved in cell wall biosynthesis